MLVACVHVNNKKPFGSLYKRLLGRLFLSFLASDGAWIWLGVCLPVVGRLCSLALPAVDPSPSFSL